MIFLIVEGALIAFIIKYRRGKRARTAEGPQIHGSTRLEVLWTVVPVVILAMIGTFVFWELPGIADAPKARAADETTIQVEGHQYYWLFRYPNGADLDQPDGRARRRGRARADRRPRLGRHPLLVGARPRRQDATRSRAGSTRPGSRRRPATTSRAAPSSAASSTRTWTAVVNVVPRAQYDAFITTRLANAASATVGQGGVAGRLPVLPPPRPQVHRPGARRQPAARRPRRASRRSCATARAQMPRRRQELDRRPDRRARRVHEAVREGRQLLDGGQRRDASRPTAPTGAAAGSPRWLTTVDHKRIGILYIWTSLVFFALGGILALLIRDAARDAERAPS